MSLEAKIELLTAAVVELTRVMQLKPNPVSAPLDEIKPTPISNITEPVRKEQAEVPNEKYIAVMDRKVDVEAQPGGAGNEQKKSSPTTDTSPPSSQASVTYDEVKAVTIAVSKIDKAKAVAGLARFGVTTAKMLKEEQWAQFVTYMRAVAAGEIDPESSHE